MRILWKSQKERDHEEDLDVGGRITLTGSYRDRTGYYGLG
jgi:hypothetical protein